MGVIGVLLGTVHETGHLGVPAGLLSQQIARSRVHAHSPG